MRKPLDDEARLRHMLEAIGYVEEFLAGKTKEDFYREPMLRFATERQLEIIGEAANRLSENHPHADRVAANCCLPKFHRPRILRHRSRIGLGYCHDETSPSSGHDSNHSA
jgi:hypothetical protein